MNRSQLNVPIMLILSRHCLTALGLAQCSVFAVCAGWECLTGRGNVNFAYVDPQWFRVTARVKTAIDGRMSKLVPAILWPTDERNLYFQIVAV